MFQNVDGRTPDAGVTGILIAHLRAFGSGELKMHIEWQRNNKKMFTSSINMRKMKQLYSLNICHVMSWNVQTKDHTRYR